MSRREQERLLRRQLIVGAAEKLFRERGFEATLMDQVALQAEFSKATVYKYVRSKEELAMLVYQKLHIKKMAAVKRAVSEHSEAVAKLRAFGMAYFEFFAEHPDYLEFQMYWDYRGLNRAAIRPELVEETAAAIADDVDFFAEVVRNGMKDGSLRPDLDVERTLDLFYLTLRSVMNQILCIDSERMLGSFIEAEPEDYSRFLELLLRSLQAEPGPVASFDLRKADARGRIR